MHPLSGTAGQTRQKRRTSLSFQPWNIPGDPLLALPSLALHYPVIRPFEDGILG
jgi:hypothetical protein